MRVKRAAVVAVLIGSLGGVPAYAGVSVSFAGSRPYTDPNIRDVPMQGQIAAYLQRLGKRYLGPGDQLSITVLDIDLAGFDLSSRGPSRPRLLNGSTTPKIKLRYRLTRHHKLVAAGEDYLTDQFYLSRPGANLSDDELRYEKALLDDWFRAKFSAGRMPAR